MTSLSAATPVKHPSTGWRRAQAACTRGAHHCGLRPRPLSATTWERTSVHARLVHTQPEDPPLGFGMHFLDHPFVLCPSGGDASFCPPLPSPLLTFLNAGCGRLHRRLENRPGHVTPNSFYHYDTVQSLGISLTKGLSVPIHLLLAVQYLPTSTTLTSFNIPKVYFRIPRFFLVPRDVFLFT